MVQRLCHDPVRQTARFPIVSIVIGGAINLNEVAADDYN